MRLSKSTAKTLLRLSQKHFGVDAELRLFGSRVNDDVRGGDIDVHVIAPNSTIKDELAFLADTDAEIGERVDLRVQRTKKILIDEVAHKFGVLLND